MKLEDKQHLLESLKEFIRTFIGGEFFVLVGLLGIIKSGINTELGTFIFNWNIAGAFFLSSTIGVVQTSLSSAFDKWLHEKAVTTPLDLTGMDSLIKERE